MSTLQLISVLVATAGLLGWVSARYLRLPITIGTMVLTIVASLALLATRTIAPGLHDWAARLVHQIHFAPVLLQGMLPLLLFAGAFLLDIDALAQEKLLVTLLSIPGTVLAFAGVAALMHASLSLVGLPANWLPCLFFGALISPTDPIAVLALLRRIGVPRNIQAQLAGESLFNDGVGAVLFIALVDVALGRTPTALSVVWLLLLKAGGGLVLGTAAGWAVGHMVRLIEAYELEIILSFALALAGYALADRLQLSAPLEAVAAGISFRATTGRFRANVSLERLRAFWEVVDHILNSVLFVLLGLGVLAIAFDRAALPLGAAAIVSVTLVRAAVVSALVLLTCRLLQPHHSSDIKLLTWGGLRGGLSIALALSIPASADQPWILPATYVVVVFSILVQGASMDFFLGRRHPAPFSPTTDSA